MTKRNIEVFTAGCPCCDEAVHMIEGAVCPSCDLQVLDMRDAAVQAMARAYGISRVPSVAVDGQLASCCEPGIDIERLRALGVGVPA